MYTSVCGGIAGVFCSVDHGGLHVVIVHNLGTEVECMYVVARFVMCTCTYVTKLGEGIYQFLIQNLIQLRGKNSTI